MQRTKWVDRKFNFDFPIGIMPSILERLRGTPARIAEMTAPLTEKQISFRHGDKWSIKEHIGHLSDLEELHEGRIEDFIVGKQILRPADMTNARTNAASHNSRNIGELLNEFTEKRQQLVSHLEKLDDTVHEIKSLHPRLQVVMRPVDMAYFTAEHDDHHLASIRELMNAK